MFDRIVVTRNDQTFTFKEYASGMLVAAAVVAGIVLLADHLLSPHVAIWISYFCYASFAFSFFFGANEVRAAAIFDVPVVLGAAWVLVHLILHMPFFPSEFLSDAGPYYFAFGTVSAFFI